MSERRSRLREAVRPERTPKRDAGHETAGTETKDVMGQSDSAEIKETVISRGEPERTQPETREQKQQEWEHGQPGDMGPKIRDREHDRKPDKEDTLEDHPSDYLAEAIKIGSHSMVQHAIDELGANVHDVLDDDEIRHMAEYNPEVAGTLANVTPVNGSRIIEDPPEQPYYVTLPVDELEEEEEFIR